ncbi:hypothetical protein BDV06DRAFT_31293 [Aspergillus oleicola]
MGIVGQGRQGREGLVRRLRTRPRPGPARTSQSSSRNRAREGRGVGMGEPEHHGPDYFSCGGRKVKSALTQKAPMPHTHACRQQEGRTQGALEQASSRGGSKLESESGTRRAALAGGWSNGAGGGRAPALGSLVGVGIGNASHAQHGATEEGQSDLICFARDFIRTACRTPKTTAHPCDCARSAGIMALERGRGCRLRGSRELAQGILALVAVFDFGQSQFQDSAALHSFEQGLAMVELESLWHHRGWAFRALIIRNG